MKGPYIWNISNVYKLYNQITSKCRQVFSCKLQAITVKWIEVNSVGNKRTANSAPKTITWNGMILSVHFENG